MGIKNIIMGLILGYLAVVGVTELLGMRIVHTGLFFPLLLLGIVTIDNGMSFIKEGSKIYGFFVGSMGGVLLLVSCAGMIME
ncbi:hypothetical protein [Salimicrobium halophilum]|uniref:DUF3953 domain-containing protein n=1 Tax=Salimicrobium halophilum TaxID=86666 RepID=A0A1G8RF87_9BACI|nr:hypothetical protein [Salimicrobium halophilum]SDJ15185.1 hypothetical protein SAMN04490247_0975 [Salimicrobium halophilum]